MKKYTRTGEKRFSVLSKKGHYTKPVLVHKTIQNPNGALVGKVLKPHKPLMTFSDAKQAKKEINDYIKHLTAAGIKVHPTTIKIIPTSKKGKCQLNFIQNLIPKNQLLPNYLKHCSEDKFFETFNQVLNIFNKIEKYNSSKTRISIDSLPLNLAIINNEVVLIDIYPAFIKNDVTIQSKNALKELRSPIIRFFTKLAPKFSNSIAQKVIDNRFDLTKRKQRMFYHFSKARPNLKKELQKRYFN